MNEDGRCKFFLWDNDAHPREAAALSNNSRSEPQNAPITPSKRQKSPPPPYTIDSSSAGPHRKRTRTVIDLEDDYGMDQNDDNFNNELNYVMEQAETPSKVARTSEFATPATRRKLPWQTGDASESSRTGLQTPQTDGRDPFNTRLTTSGSGSRVTPLRNNELNDNFRQDFTPTSSFETPTPSRSKDAAVEDLEQDVFSLLESSNVRLGHEAERSLRSLLTTHVRNAEGYKRGRDVTRTTIKAKEAKITELTYRVSTLEAELEAEKALVKHLQWEAGSQADT